MLQRISNNKLKKQLIGNIKMRELGQKFLYLEEGSDNYYAYASQKVEESIFYLEFFKKHFSSLQNIILISLGCGNAWHDKLILEHYSKIHTKFLYLGVDTSASMLEKANDNLKTCVSENVAIKFIHADFTSDSFVDNLYSIIWKNDSKIFSFLGNSFSNINQTSITDTLYNILGNEDYLWLDLPCRIKDTYQVQLQLFENYSAYLNIPLRVKFWFSPLSRLWIPLKNWKIVLETTNEPSIGSILFSYHFVFKAKTIVKYKWQTIHFLPDESIKLHSIRNYYGEQFKYFFGEHEFKLINENSIMLNDRLELWQYLFKKK